VKIWHDDIRRPPDESWTWARTNQDAMRLLLTNDVTEMSLDHDLGLHNHDPDADGAVMLRGQDEKNNGRSLAYAMVLLNIVPPKINVHSWNPEGAKWMAGIIDSYGGIAITIKPYEV
jgi:hypothetical protein